MKFYYGVCTGEQGTGIGDIISGKRWRYRNGDKSGMSGVDLLTFDNEWIEVFTIFVTPQNRLDVIA